MHLIQPIYPCPLTLCGRTLIGLLTLISMVIGWYQLSDLNKDQERALKEFISFLAKPAVKHMVLSGPAGAKVMAPYTVMYS